MSDRIYRFERFELLSSDGELRTLDSCVKLQEKPLRLLIALLDNPRQIVTRDQLRERMWDKDTFVDYEQGINVAIKKLREALGDSADTPKYIQTVAKKGYRFLLPVDVEDSQCLAAKAAPAEIPIPDSENARRSSTSRPLVRRFWHFGAIGVVILAVGSVWLFSHEKASRRPAQIHSIAVLPLRNLSPDPNQEYIVDGITEDLITNLAQTLPLRVISRTSVMRYKQTTEPVSRIARELGVEAIVEGSVIRSGDRVSVTVQLIDATEDRHLWAQRYDRNLGDLLEMEAELSQRIASQVGGTLSRRSVKTTKVSRPVDAQVYDLCLMGRYNLNKRTAAGLAKSAEYFQKAISLDPAYAPAYAGLGAAYALMPSYDSVHFRETYAKATAAVHHALELDDTLAEAHATLGLIGLNQPGDWKRTEPEFRRALDINPNYATAHHWYAFYLRFSGRQDEALAEMELARELDPLSVIINADQGEFFYAARLYDQAKAPLLRAIELAPDLGQPRETLALIALETGHLSDATRQARAGLALASTNPRTIGVAGYVLAVAGKSDEAKELLTKLTKMIQTGSGSPVFAALIYMGLRQRKEALDAIEECEELDAPLQGIEQWHAFDELKSDPRFQSLLARSKESKIALVDTR